ncbi:hypothetical protein SLOPH_238 [Spraguea lophii 42_110]|uniref:C2H2-type domain-containing protein n=1 Tax=Spraguea lophii (strain 42_110) TaxID=1358809 RepID=S7WA75_SPRLO|nr:hypothetical protein SLOPH_238 [Spraguea lophii 42_110]
MKEFREYIKYSDRLYIEKRKIKKLKQLSTEYPKKRVLKDHIIYKRRKRIMKIKKKIQNILTNKENDNSITINDKIIEEIENKFITDHNKKIKIPLKQIIKEKIERMFTKKEYYGEMVDVLDIYEKYKLSFPHIKSYKVFLHQLQNLDNFSKSSFEYYFMLKELASYFKNFIKKAFPLKKVKLQIDECISSEPYLFFSENIFCICCDKSIKENLYKYHKDGKKHRKNAIENNKIFEVEYHEVYITEQIIKEYILILKQQIINTILIKDTEDNMTRKHSERKNDEFTPKDNKGNIIPLWLYKYYGLNINYHCELCNIKIKGKYNYEKHFNTITHNDNLKNLGITEINKFFGILKLKEIEELQRNIEDREENELYQEEVEDEQGNIYDKKTYEELKRLGML